MKPLALLPLLVASATGDAALHPNDGPDVDVRIRVGEEAVVCHLLLNLAFVDEVVDVPREDVNALHEVEHDPLRAELYAFFKRENTVWIDGVEVVPLEGGFDVTPAQEHLLPLFPNCGARALIKVGLELTYPVKQPPGSVRIAWGPFPPDYVLATPEGTPPIEVVAQLSAGGQDSLVRFTQDEPEHTWRGSLEEARDRFLPVPDAIGAAAREMPLLSIALAVLAGLVLVFALATGPESRLRRRAPALMVLCFAGAFFTRGVARVQLPGSGSELLTNEQALAIFKPLHANIYRAFDYEAEGDVYDALARSVEGDLLDELYNEMYRSLILQEAGGAVSKVQAVALLEAGVASIERAPDGRLSFEVEARWQVDGAVYHWGHAHTRLNEYRASYTVRSGERSGEHGWRIAGSRMLEQFRVSSSPLEPGHADPLPDFIPPEQEDL